MISLDNYTLFGVAHKDDETMNLRPPFRLSSVSILSGWTLVWLARFVQTRLPPVPQLLIFLWAL